MAILYFSAKLSEEWAKEDGGGSVAKLLKLSWPTVDFPGDYLLAFLESITKCVSFF